MMKDAIATTETNAVTLGDAREFRRARIARVSVRYQISQVTQGEAVVGDALDISVGGVFIQASRSLPVGFCMPLEIRIVGEPLSVEAVGRVAWTRDVASGSERPLGFGVQFLEVDDEGIDLIARLVAMREPTMHGLGSDPESERAIRAPQPSEPLSLVRVKAAREPSTPLFLVTRKVPALPAQAIAATVRHARPAPARHAPRVVVACALGVLVLFVLRDRATDTIAPRGTHRPVTMTSPVAPPEVASVSTVSRPLPVLMTPPPPTPQPQPTPMRTRPHAVTKAAAAARPKGAAASEP